jgi:hypothetical protein
MSNDGDRVHYLIALQVVKNLQLLGYGRLPVQALPVDRRFNRNSVSVFYCAAISEALKYRFPPHVAFRNPDFSHMSRSSAHRLPSGSRMIDGGPGHTQ